MDTEDSVAHEAQGEMVWPTSDPADPSQSFLDLERAKYLPTEQSMFLSWKGLLEKVRWVYQFFFQPCVSPENLREPSPAQPGIATQATVIATDESPGQMMECEDNEMSSASEEDAAEAVLFDKVDDSGVTPRTTVETYVSKAEVKMVRVGARDSGNVVVVPQEGDEMEAADNETERFDDCLTGEPEIVISKFEEEAHDQSKQEASLTEELSTNELKEESVDSKNNIAGEGNETSITGTFVQAEYETGVEITEVKQDYNEEFTLASEDLNQTSDSSQQIPEIEVTQDFEAEGDFEKVDKDLQLVEEELTEMKDHESASDIQLVDEAEIQQSTHSSSSSSSSSDASNEGVDSSEVLDESVESDKIDSYAETVEEVQEETLTVSESQIEVEVVQAESDVKVEELEITADAEASIASEENKEEIQSSAAELSVPVIAVTEVTVGDESSDKANESFSTTDEKTSKDEVESVSGSSIRSKKDEKLMKVDKVTKRLFKRKVKSYIKQIVKSRDLPSFSKNHDDGVVITPTVFHVGTDEKTSLTLKKTELSGSRSSLLGRLSAKEDEFVRLVSLVGFEGYGKSTLMKRYADMATGRVVNVNELAETGMKRWHPFARKDFFKFVHYIDLRDLPTEGEYTVDELLFQILIKDMTPNEAEVGYRWLQIYKKSMLFIIDSVNDLDLFPEEVRQHVGFSDRASPQTIMYNLLTGNILPKAHVLISSSVTNTSHIAEVLSPDRVYVLSGFDRNDIKTYLAKNTKVFKVLTDGSNENLFASSKVPLGMFYSANALSDEHYRLDSLLGAISHYVRTAVTGNGEAKTDSDKILTKLKKLSFQCSLQGDEVVHESLPSMSLTSEDLASCRLFVEKSVGRIGADDTMRWIKTFTFGHVTIREYLSALHLAEADMDAFTKFTNENFGVARFDFQQKSLYGLLFHDANLEYARDLVTVSHFEEKRNLLRQILLGRLQAKSPSFYLYTIVHESPDGIDDIVKENLRTLSIVGEKLTTVSMFILSCVASRVGTLDELELRKCYPSDDTIRRFLSAAKHDETKIKTLNLRENPGILTCGASIREMCQNCNVEELDFGDCNFRGDVLAALPRILRDVELKVLRIDDNPEISENSLQGVGEFIKKTNVKKFGISNTDLNEAKLERFEKSVKKFQFDSLDLRKNREIGSLKTISIVGSIASECKLQDLNMAFCGVMSKHCQSFKESLEAHKLKKLDISALEPIDVSLEDIDHLSNLLSCIEEELRIENWEFSSEALTVFIEKVESTGHEDVKIFYGSKNESFRKQK